MKAHQARTSGGSGGRGGFHEYDDDENDKEEKEEEEVEVLSPAVLAARAARHASLALTPGDAGHVTSLARELGRALGYSFARAARAESRRITLEQVLSSSSLVVVFLYTSTEPRAPLVFVQVHLSSRAKHICLFVLVVVY